MFETEPVAGEPSMEKKCTTYSSSINIIVVPGSVLPPRTKMPLDHLSTPYGPAVNHLVRSGSDPLLHVYDGFPMEDGMHP